MVTTPPDRALVAGSSRPDRSHTDGDALDVVAAVLAHDLRAPSRHVVSLAALIDETLDPVPGGELAEYLRLLTAAGRRMQHLTTGLATYVRLGRPALDSEPVALGPVVAAAVDDCWPDVVRAGAAIDIVGDWPTVDGDALLLSRAVAELVGNATRHAGRPEPRVRIACSVDGWAVSLSVSDDGVGIDPAHHERIFELFTALRPSTDELQGGLGLAVASRIADLHGGRLTVASSPGTGTTFTLALPARTTELGVSA